MRMDAESEVFLQEHDFYGVGCVATHEGSQTPPQLRVEIDGKDETESFQVIHEVSPSLKVYSSQGRQSHLKTGSVMGPGLKTGSVVALGVVKKFNSWRYIKLD